MTTTYSIGQQVKMKQNSFRGIIIVFIIFSFSIDSVRNQVIEHIYQSIVDRVGQLREVLPFTPLTNLLSTSSVHPDAFRNFTQLAESRGFKAEVHKVTTYDGYIITMHRLMNPLVTMEERKLLRPVIIQHGIMCSSDDFMTNALDSLRPMRPAHLVGIQNARLGAEAKNKTIKVTMSSTNQNKNQTVSYNNHTISNAIAFTLANYGYDVWLPNTRGNLYSREHISFTDRERLYWDFSLDELVKYDLPAAIDYVQKQVSYGVEKYQQVSNKPYNKTKIAFIGHSQGTTMMFGLLASQPDIYTDIIEPFIALAPVVYLKHIHTPVKYLIHFKPFTELFTSPVAGTGPFQRLLPLICLRSSSSELCSNTVFLASGFDEQQYDKDRISVYVRHLPTGTSWKILNHYGQMYDNGIFRMYDHGPSGNQARFGKLVPPAYNISNIRSRSLVFMSSANDWFGPPEDVARLRSELTGERESKDTFPSTLCHNTIDMLKRFFLLSPDTNQYSVPIYYDFYIDDTRWSHLDFMFAKDAGRLINTRILKILNEFSYTQNIAAQAIKSS